MRLIFRADMILRLRQHWVTCPVVCCGTDADGDSSCILMRSVPTSVQPVDWSWQDSESDTHTLTSRVGVGAKGGQFLNVKGYLWMKDGGEEEGVVEG